MSSITSKSKYLNLTSEIKAETIAQNILNQLGIKNKLKFKTVKIGKHFHNECVEVVPNFFGFSKKLQGKPINIRADLHFEFQFIFNT